MDAGIYRYVSGSRWSSHPCAPLRQGECNIARPGRQIERARAAEVRRIVDEPLLPSAILAVRQRRGDEVVPVGNPREQGAHVDALALGSANPIAQRHWAIIS